MSLNFQQSRQLLQDFDFAKLFIEVLGWSNPSSAKPVAMEIEDETYQRKMVAELSGVVVLEVMAADGKIPEVKVRRQVHKAVAELHLENLLIFVDKDRTQSLWYWVKREGKKLYPREHIYVKGQPGDLFLGKISALVVDFAELEDGLPSVVAVAQKLQQGLDVERVTKRFFDAFQKNLADFMPQIQGIENEADRRWYASVILNRLMFVYFLQRKQFIDGDVLYLQNKLALVKEQGKAFYQDFLLPLFFEGFAKPESDREEAVKTLLGQVKYLNGGLFLKHRIEQTYPNIAIPNGAFEAVFELFAGYSWNLDDTPGGKDDEINPGVLGYIFEKYINQKEFGAYYTRPEITEYLCDRTINQLILDKVNGSFASISPHPLAPSPSGEEELDVEQKSQLSSLPSPLGEGLGMRGNNAAPKPVGKTFESIGELILKLDANLCDRLLNNILPQLSLLDPACGSGAFLVAAMKTLINVYSAVLMRAELFGDRALKQAIKKIRADHPSLLYYIKKRIITDNLYGVDIMEEATEIAKLRLFLALVASAQAVEDLEPLPNIDFNIMAGNSLIGLIRVDEESFDALGEEGDKQLSLLGRFKADRYGQILADKNESIRKYKAHSFQSGEVEGTSQENRLLMLRDHIEKINREAQAKLNQLLLEEFRGLKIKYEAAQLTGKAKKRDVVVADIEALEPFHWGYHFDQIIGERGGFDAIIANPPWEIFKPNSREFFTQHNELVKKSKMDIKDFEKEQKKLLQDPEISAAWLDYQNQFPHVSTYYRSSDQYKNQISIVNGKKAGSDINLYKLFLEKCFHLLNSDGRCGMIIPTGFYTDLGAKQLREMIFSESRLDTLLGLSNERFIFEGVDHRFKFCLLTFEKGGSTKIFEACFRIDPRESIRPNQLDNFLQNKSERVEISVDLVRQLSPDSFSVMEFRDSQDIIIAKKMFQRPRLGDKLDGTWNFKLNAEFHMTSDSKLFRQKEAEGLLPLYEGKMIHQFTHLAAEPRYWLHEDEARQSLLGRDEIDEGQELSYQFYRLAIRAIARTTDSRTLISTILPKSIFCGNSILVSSQGLSDDETILVQTFLNSFVVDFCIRQMVSANINMFYVYQIPVPRLQKGDRYFSEIVDRAAKLICTTPEFDDLAQEVGLGSHHNGITDESERAKLRAELDGTIAHLYNLTETEFTHILSTFPIVPEPTKQAALEAYRALIPLPGDRAIADLITQGESATLEFKSTARWDLKEHKKNPALEQVILKTIAAFLNTGGGTLLIGIADDGTVLGLTPDYQTLQKKNRDGLELWLTDFLLKNNLGQDLAPFLQITFHDLDNQDICRIIAKPAPRPIYVKDNQDDHLYIRSGNSTRKLTVKEAINHVKNQWRE
jgi:Putative DNA-binding domain/Eco57I restriction-modification methylase